MGRGEGRDGMIAVNIGSGSNVGWNGCDDGKSQ